MTGRHFTALRRVGFNVSKRYSGGKKLSQSGIRVSLGSEDEALV